ncbi:MAG: sulfotransferase family protein [Almyronema sp.]
MFQDKKIIFVGGLHRSGTSLLHELIREHPLVSGFNNTGVPEDEGQHLQSVYLPAINIGGPGSFGFHNQAFMDETHPLAIPSNAEKLFKEWSQHWNTDCPYLLEKSPPNVVRTRFLQHLFPNSIFLVLLRHPLATAYATKKWSKNHIGLLIKHWLVCYERFLLDYPYLRKVYILHYEDFVKNPHEILADFLKFAGLDAIPIKTEVTSDINNKYFSTWKNDEKNIAKFFLHKLYISQYEYRLRRFGYSLSHPEKTYPVEYTGSHVNDEVDSRPKTNCKQSFGTGTLPS